MISILISTYNYVVVKLVRSILDEASNLPVKFEIIVSDDGSSNAFSEQNQIIGTLKNCVYHHNKNNVGLSENRNILATLANYDNLLYIDGDSELISGTYLNDYLLKMNTGYEVIYGGRVHPENVSKQQRLRWKYGKLIEDRTATDRNLAPYKSILFNNTVIKKHLVSSIGFAKSINTYGHEDTLFAYELSKLKAKVIHMDNPVRHGDVDINVTYIKKTENALENLNQLYKSKLINPNFVTFLRVYERLMKFRLIPIIKISFFSLRGFIKKNLKSNNPSLTLFNFYRLGYFCGLQ